VDSGNSSAISVSSDTSKACPGCDMSAVVGVSRSMSISCVPSCIELLTSNPYCMHMINTMFFHVLIYIYIIYIILLYLYNLIIYILYIYSAHPCKDILKINNMYNIFTIHTYDKRCISLRSLYIKNVSHNWLISIGSMVIQGSLNIYDVSQIWYTPMWWYVSFFSSVSLDPVGKEEEVKEGKR
jgi:hypothetical protein